MTNINTTIDEKSFQEALIEAERWEYSDEADGMLIGHSGSKIALLRFVEIQKMRIFLESYLEKASEL